MTISHSAIKPNIKPCNYCAAGVVLVLVQEDGGSCSHPSAASNYHCGPQLCATLSPDPLPTKVSTKFCKAQYSEKNSESTYYSTFILTNQSRNYYEQPLFSSNGIKITVKLCCHLYIPTLTTGRKYSGKPQFLFLFLPRLRMITVIIPSPPSIVAQEAMMIQWLPNCPHSAPVMVSGDSNQFPRSVAVQITP